MFSTDQVRAAVITAVLVVNLAWALPLGDTWDASVARPLRTTFGRFGLNQSWAMFAKPDRWPHRIEVHVREAGEWRQVYDRWDPGDPLQPVLRQRRVRGMYDALGDDGTVMYWNFTRWLAREVLLQHPKADVARIRMVRTHTRLPTEPPDPGQSLHLVHEHKRTAVLPEDDLW